MSVYELLKKYLLEHDHCVPTKDRLYKWCRKQHILFDSLSKEKQMLLNAIKFKKYYTETDWDTRYRWLMRFLKENKTTPTLLTNKTLCIWYWTQKRKAIRNELKGDKKKKITAIIQKYKRKYSDSEIWDNQFEALVNFIKENKIWPRRIVTESVEHKRFNWCQAQKKKQSKQCYPYTPLKPHQVDQLNSIGFKWTDNNVYETRWLVYFVKLKNYVESVGSTLIPEKEAGKKTIIYRFLSAQKKAIENKKLNQKKIEMLTDLGVL